MSLLEVISSQAPVLLWIWNAVWRQNGLTNESRRAGTCCGNLELYHHEGRVMHFRLQDKVDYASCHSNSIDPPSQVVSSNATTSLPAPSASTRQIVYLPGVFCYYGYILLANQTIHTNSPPANAIPILVFDLFCSLILVSSNFLACSSSIRFLILISCSKFLR
jgi:hypothetical protein